MRLYDIHIKAGHKISIKKRGNGDFLICLVCYMLMFVILFYALDMFRILDLAMSKTAMARKYMLGMESRGYLCEEEMQSLKMELTDMGVEDISFDGTTFHAAGYGNEVILCVTGYVYVRGVTGIDSEFKFIRDDKRQEFKMYYKSTAKY